MNLLQIVLTESEKFVRLFILKVKKQELIEIIVQMTFIYFIELWRMGSEKI